MNKNLSQGSGESPGSLTVFFPAYNDAGSIAGLVHTALEILPQLTSDYEIVVVNDGSADHTRETLDQLARTTPCLRVIHHEQNRGYGGALRSGFLNATKDLVFYTDGDGQYDVRDLLRLAPLLTAEVDVVNGYKRKRSDNFRRVILGEMYKFMACTMFWLPIRDVDCDFRLMRRSAIQSIDLTSTSGVVCTEMIYKLHQTGARFVETSVQHYPRLYGQSQFFTWRRVGKTAFDFLILWVRLVILARLTSPLRKPVVASEETL